MTTSIERILKIFLTIIAVVAFAAVLAIFIVAIVSSVAHSHQAPSGWAYAAGCCSGRDCHHIAVTAVSAQPDGWHVHVEPGEHPSLTKAADFVVPYDKAKPSGDSEFHICIHQRTGTVMCLYVPQQGV